MPSQFALSRRAFAAAFMATVLASSCAKVDSGSSRNPDSVLASPGDTSPIPDKSLRPPPEGVEPAIRFRGMPVDDSAGRRADTVASFAAAETARASRPDDPDLTVLRRELVVPVRGVDASALHDTFSELRGGTRPHEALDILAPRGTPVLSAANGRVLKLFKSTPGGLMVYAADSSGRFILLYGHLDAYAAGLTDGQALRQGQQIGVVGTTGNAPANTPHLHFAIARAADLTQWWKGTPINPFPLLTP